MTSPESDRIARRYVAGALAASIAAGGVAWATISGASRTGPVFFERFGAGELGLMLGLLWSASLLAARARSRAACRAWMVASTAAALTWLSLEAAGLAGMVDYGMFIGRPQGMLGSRLEPHVDVSGTTHEDTAGIWGLETTPIDYHFKTDRYGLRNHVDRASADVYLVGDSFLVAGLVAFEQTLAARLERRLARPVMNVALGGLSVQAEAALLERIGVPLHERLVVQFVFEGNDMLESIERAARVGPSIWSRSLTLNAIRTIERAAMPWPRHARTRVGYVGDRYYTFEYTGPETRAHDDQIPAILETLESVRQRVVGAGGTYGVALIPAKLRVIGPLCRWPPESELTDYAAHLSTMPAALAAWSRRTSIPFLDLTPALIAAARAGRVPWFQGDTHWNATGHEVAASALARAPWVRAWHAGSGAAR